MAKVPDYGWEAERPGVGELGFSGTTRIIVALCAPMDADSTECSRSNNQYWFAVCRRVKDACPSFHLGRGYALAFMYCGVGPAGRRYQPSKKVQIFSYQRNDNGCVPDSCRAKKK